LHFRHKSQLRLHLRQKHGAITNTKIQYRLSSMDPPTPLLSPAC
jgi:B-cell lymphoma 6 protein